MGFAVFKDTQSSQIVRELERRIRSGVFLPGHKMPSTRELARQFDVSQQVIKSAVEEMEKGLMVLRKPRIGIYVNPAVFSPGMTDLCLLTSSNIPHTTDYLSRFLSFDDLELWKDVNLATRYLSVGEIGKSSLRYELEKIKEMHPKCLLVHINLENEGWLRHFTSLPFPVVFLGDFSWGRSSVTGLNQIVEDTGERAAAMVRAAYDCGASNAVMVAGSLKNFYCRLLKPAGEKEALKVGLGFRYVEYQDGSSMIDEISARRRDCVRRILEDGCPDMLLLDGFQRIDIFSDALVESRPRHGRTVQMIADGEMRPGAIYLQSDFRDFSRAAMGLVKELASNPSKPFGRVVLSGKIQRRPLKITQFASAGREDRQTNLKMERKLK
ncbi:MAG: winged helix-turn-helix domain-containing protein [Victivallales bacterium]